MSNYVFQKSIVATLGIAIPATGTLAGISSHAQNGLPETMTTPSPSPTMMPTTTPNEVIHVIDRVILPLN